MKANKFSFLALFALVIVTTSCSNDNAITPNPSNTNYISFQYAVGEANASNIWEFPNDNSHAQVTLKVDEIDQYIVDYGSVLVQIYDVNTHQWYPVPYSSSIDPNDGYQEVYGFSYGPGQVKVTVESHNAYYPDTFYPLDKLQNTKIKVIITNNI